jgi:hypothetical protein
MDESSAYDFSLPLGIFLSCRQWKNKAVMAVVPITQLSFFAKVFGQHFSITNFVKDS